MNILLIACVLVGSICIIRGFFSIDSSYLTRGGIILIISALMICILSSSIDRGPSEELKEQRNEYTVYLDGNEIENNKIDLSLYSVKYDDDKRIAYATKKSDTNFIPLFIPWKIE